MEKKDKGKYLCIRVTEDEQAKFKKAAEQEGYSLSAFLRRAASLLSASVLLGKKWRGYRSSRDEGSDK
jgi:uncharacterized protein (DUF1778 family)